MKTLIVYYTRTGTTRIACEALAKELSADIEELKDPNDYSGVLGYLKAGRAAMTRADVKIAEQRFDPANYELVVIGTPVWGGLCAPAVRAYIKTHKLFLKNVAVLTTQGGSKKQRVFVDLADQLGHELYSEVFLMTKEVRTGNFMEKLREFIK